MAFLASHSSENTIRERLLRLNATNDFLAALSGIPASRLSAAWRGVKPLDGATAEKLLELTAQLGALAEALKPVPVSMTNPAAIRVLLDSIRINNIANERISETMTRLFNQ
jgi:hypothetical protein